MISDLKTSTLNSPDHLSDDSRVWIYQSERPLTGEEVQQMNAQIASFTGQWTSHNRTLYAFGRVYHDRFIVVFLDEHASHGASGCSIDALVHFIQHLGGKHAVDLMNRLLFYVQKGDDILAIPMHELSELVQKGDVSSSDRVFNSLVKTKKEWDENWLVPLKDSWHARFL